MSEQREAFDLIRAEMQREINAAAAARAELEAKHGKVWNSAEMVAEFDVSGFCAPFVVVRRRSDGKNCSLMFQHSPRLYFNWQED